MSNGKLAILGGEPAVTIKNPEQWRREVEEEKKLVCDLIDRGAISGSGTGISKEFEDEFREFIGAKYCLTVSHGSTALASAFYAVGVGPGDEFITPAIGYIGSYEGALHLGARPVFCEIDPKTLLIDPRDAERKITPRTRAINIIHMNGRVCDMDSFLAIGKKHGIAIVEDAAHAHGSEWDGKKVGNVGDIACFSMQGTTPGGKPVAAGEGGITVTNTRLFYERMLIYCHLHRSGITSELTLPEYRGFDSQVLGRKWRAHPLAIAIAKVSFRTLEYRNQRRIENRDRIFAALQEMPGVEPVHTYPKSRNAGFYGGLKLLYNPEELDGLPGGKLAEAIRAEGASIGGPGVGHIEHLRMIYTRGFDLWGHDRGPLGGEFCGLLPFKPYKKGDFPVSESLADKVFTLPAYIDPKPGFLDQYIEAFRKVTKNYKDLL